MESNVIKDLKEAKGYILGVIAFATAVSGFCVGVFHWEPNRVTAIAAVCACLAISLAVLIQRAENRNIKRLENHQKDANESWDRVDKALKRIEVATLENQRSSIRIEMNSYIRNEPQNHDTILAYAQRYFVDLNGDWKETDVFLSWVDRENEAGRKVHVPIELLSNVTTKKSLEQ